ncbi:hypothetical protein [Streptacidiphilus rugosus]|uniref:hypothetical protein n=1 Tax=Streptacidiphilus rugosus TaxID=405783 RepID=UPI0006919D22|nr:hypothetical protein [Streptacidiphilus rugosus]
MSRTLRRGAVAAVIVAIAPVLAACSAGSSAATLEIKPNVAATTLQIPGGGQLKLNGIAVVTDANGNAPANVVANIANNESQDDNLVSVTVGTTAATLTGNTKIPQGGSILLSTPGVGNPIAQVATLAEPAGATVPVTFGFANGGPVTISVQIQLGTGDYASYAPATPPPAPVVSQVAAAPAGTSTPKAGAGHKASPTATPTH